MVFIGVGTFFAQATATGFVSRHHTQTPRRPVGAGGVRGASRSGSASVITTHALFARKVEHKLSNGVAGFAAGGSSPDRKRSRPIRGFSATPHDGPPGYRNGEDSQRVSHPSLVGLRPRKMKG